jgi:hypothetical protein
VRYRLGRDREVAGEEAQFHTATEPALERLSRIIFELYPRMMRGNESFHARPRSGDVAAPLSGATRFFVESFLVQDVRGDIEGPEQQFVGEMATALLKFNAKFIGRGEGQFNLHIKPATTVWLGRMVNAWDSFQNLSDRQRNVVFRCLLEYRDALEAGLAEHRRRMAAAGPSAKLVEGEPAEAVPS